jgi:DNA-binding NarL/FixJ family response regulator
MESEHDTSLFSHYDRLVAEYQACTNRCQASLDQLQATERELRALTAKIGSRVKPERSLEIECALSPGFGHSEAHEGVPIEQLSARERQVLGLIGQGLPTAQIAAQLQLAASTVETYRERLKTKLHLNSGLELIRYAVLWLADNGYLAAPDSDLR